MLYPHNLIILMAPNREYFQVIARQQVVYADG